MAYRLKSRVHQCVGGFQFIQPEIRWESLKVLGRSPSWERLVNAVIEARRANPHHLQKHGWSLDPTTVADEVDAYNAQRMLDGGYTKYLKGPEGQPAPKSLPPGRLLISRAGNAAAGGETLVEWLASGAEAVSHEKSESRARTCLSCKHNESGDLLSFFTRPVSEAIRFALNLRRDWNLKTEADDQLGVCEICDCPLKLKVHLPIERIQSRIPEAVLARLPGHCWIPGELSTRVDT